jgi:hypothetical protein
MHPPLLLLLLLINMSCLDLNLSQPELVNKSFLKRVTVVAQSFHLLEFLCFDESETSWTSKLQDAARHGCSSGLVDAQLSCRGGRAQLFTNMTSPPLPCLGSRREGGVAGHWSAIGRCWLGYVAGNKWQ